jgi:hypothetical protein
MKQTIKKNIRRINDFNYHKMHKRTALSDLKNIEVYKGKLPNHLSKKCIEYAKNIFGSKKYAPWLKVYSAMAGEFKEGWIPDNYYGRIVIPKTKGLHGELSEMKTINSIIFRGEDLLDIVYYINGILFNADYKPINESNLVEYLFNKFDKIVYKLDNSYRGRGVFVIKKEEFNWSQLKNLGNGTFQKFIVQNPFFSHFMPNSVATLRITTTSSSSKITTRSAILKFGRSSDRHVNATSLMQISTDLISGELDEYGYYLNWKRVKKHPDTKVIFKNSKIPEFNRIIKYCEDLHTKVPFISCIGWDVILDNNNKIQLIEWNSGHNGVKFAEAMIGPCFKDMGWEKLPKNN